MPQMQPQVDLNDPAVVQELLRQKGLIASGGNIRAIPFANASPRGAANGMVGSADATAPVSGTPNSSGEIAIGPDGEPIVDRSGMPVPVGATDADVDPSLLPYILGGAAAVGGGMIAKHLADRYRNRVPTIEGQVIDDGMSKPTMMPSEFEGEYTDVEEPRALTDQRTRLIADGRPTPAVAETIAQQRAPRGAPQVTAPRANSPRTQVNSGRTVVANDAYSDVAPDEMKKVQGIVDELVRNRQVGNATKTPGKATHPTGPLNRNAILNSIIGLLRDQKALKSLQRVAQ